MPRTARPRVERAQSTSGTEVQAEFLESIRSLLPAIAKSWQTGAAIDPVIAREVIGLLKEDFSRARAGDRDELLLRLAEVRKAGSPIIEDYWNKVYGRLYPIGS